MKRGRGDCNPAAHLEPRQGTGGQLGSLAVEVAAMTYIRKMLLVVLFAGTAANVWWWSDRFMVDVTGTTKAAANIHFETDADTERFMAARQREAGAFMWLWAVRVEAALVAAVAIVWVLTTPRRPSPADTDPSG
jgi:hypothetical protein